MELAPSYPIFPSLLPANMSHKESNQRYRNTTILLADTRSVPGRTGSPSLIRLKFTPCCTLRVSCLALASTSFHVRDSLLGVPSSAPAWPALFEGLRPNIRKPCYVPAVEAGLTAMGELVARAQEQRGGSRRRQQGEGRVASKQ